MTNYFCGLFHVGVGGLLWRSSVGGVLWDWGWSGVCGFDGDCDINFLTIFLAYFNLPYKSLNIISLVNNIINYNLRCNSMGFHKIGFVGRIAGWS